MSSDDNLYRAPQSSLQTIAQDGELTPAMVEYLSKGAFWARVLSIFLFLCFIGMGFYVFSLFYTSSEHMRQLGISSEDANVMAFLIGVFLGGALTLIMLWLLGIRMHRYAKACKMLRVSENIEDVEQCFFNSSSFLKILAILSILSIIFGFAGSR